MSSDFENDFANALDVDEIRKQLLAHGISPNERVKVTIESVGQTLLDYTIPPSDNIVNNNIVINTPLPLTELRSLILNKVMQAMDLVGDNACWVNELPTTENGLVNFTVALKVGQVQTNAINVDSDIPLFLIRGGLHCRKTERGCIHCIALLTSIPSLEDNPPNAIDNQ